MLVIYVSCIYRVFAEIFVREFVVVLVWCLGSVHCCLSVFTASWIRLTVWWMVC